MNVSSSGYYSWLNRPISNRDKENRELTKMIEEIFTQNRNVYGTRRIAKKLAERGVFISRHRMES
jgi:putative transposase